MTTQLILIGIALLICITMIIINYKKEVNQDVNTIVALVVGFLYLICRALDQCQ